MIGVLILVAVLFAVISVVCLLMANKHTKASRPPEAGYIPPMGPVAPPPQPSIDAEQLYYYAHRVPVRVCQACGGENELGAAQCAICGERIL